MNRRLNPPLEFLDRLSTAVMLLAVATTALFICTRTYDQFILPKIVWIKALTEIAAVLVLLRLAAGGDFRLRLHWINLALLVFVTWKAASWFWAESASLAADEIRWWAALWVWSLLFQDWLRNDRRRLRECGAALTISALAVSLWLLVQDFAVAFYQEEVAYLTRLPAPLRDALRWLLDRLSGAQTSVARLPDWRGHLWAGMGNTNHIADYLALLFPMVFLQYLTCSRRRKEAETLQRTSDRPPYVGGYVALATLVVSAAALIACYSVGSNGGLILAGALMAVLFLVHEPREFWRGHALRIAVLLALWAAITAFYVFPHRLNPHLWVSPSGESGGIFTQAFDSDRWRAGWPTRVAIWLNSWEVVRQHPLLGVGAGSFTYGYTKTISPRVLNDPELAVYAGMFTNAAHNELLQSWVETGVAGPLLLLMLWIVFFVSVSRRLGESEDSERRLRILLLAMMTAFVAHSMMNFTLQLPTSSLLFMGMLSVAATLRGRQDFPLRVRMPYAVMELDLETTGMRRIESVGFRLGESRALRATVAVFAAAAGLFFVARTIRPTAADTLFNRAKIAAQWFQAWPAVEDFTLRALAINPDHHTARKLLGDAMLAMKRHEEARSAYEKVAERESVFDFYDKWGWACWNLGDRDGARRAWTIYFTRCPQARERENGKALYDLFMKEFPEDARALR